MRTIFIHIGCGKTGSSALQIWLSQNAHSLADKGIDYPTFGCSISNDYEITNGNGPQAVDAVRSGRAGQFFESLLDSYSGNILLSSENFQMLDRKQLLDLAAVFQRLAVMPVIVAYVRDLYDVLSSGYHQLVKRHLFQRSFNDFVCSLKGVQQFEVLANWSSVFEELIVLHYDTEKNRLDRSFLEALGVDSTGFPEMNKNRVNRSLSGAEIEILRLLNKSLSEKYSHDAACASSRAISDMFIYKKPEADSYMFHDEKIENMLLQRFGSQVNDINQKYFEGQDVLRVFRRKGKTVATEPYSLPYEFVVAIETLMLTVDSANAHATHAPSATNKREPLKIADPRIVDALREEAIRREATDLAASLELMAAAKVLRPDGPLINQKISQYKASLDLEKKGA